MEVATDPASDNVTSSSGRAVLRKSGGIYRSGDLLVMPGPPERVLAYTYFRMQQEKLLLQVFHESETEPTLKWFLETYSNPESSALGCYVATPEGQFGAGDERWDVAGLCWISAAYPIGTNFRKAEPALMFFRKQPHPRLKTFGHMVIEWAFDNLAIDALIGSTPHPNRAAVLYGRELGFMQAGPVLGWTMFNGRLCSAVMQSMTRDLWREMKWFEEAA